MNGHCHHGKSCFRVRTPGQQTHVDFLGWDVNIASTRGARARDPSGWPCCKHGFLCSWTQKGPSLFLHQIRVSPPSTHSTAATSTQWLGNDARPGLAAHTRGCALILVPCSRRMGSYSSVGFCSTLLYPRSPNTWGRSLSSMWVLLFIVAISSTLGVITPLNFP